MSTAVLEPTGIEVGAPSELARVQLRLLRRLMAAAPFQPATNLWRAIELPEAASALPAVGRGLDVGCGDGALTRILADLVQADWQLVGIDPDAAETSLAAASGRYLRVHIAGGGNILEADESFDFALANSVLEHVIDVAACLVEVARCLRPGGMFVITVPSPHFHKCLRGPARPRDRRKDYLRAIDKRLAHLHYWSRQRWRGELARAGLQMESITWYLSRKQVHRWERLSNATGGLLYRRAGSSQPPIQIQRRLGLRRALPRPLRLFAHPVASIVGRGVLGDREPLPERNGCYMIKARKIG